MVKKLKQLYAKQTLYQKVRLIILLFSIPSLVCPGGYFPGRDLAEPDQQDQG